MGRNYSATAVDTTLASAITSTATSFSVAATVGFPTAPFVIAVIDSPGAQEIMLVTGVVGTSLTVTRAYDATTAAAHPATAVVRHVASAIDFREAALHIDAVSGVHGVGAGSVVGTANAQTLTNKNLTSGTNTFPTFITGYLTPTGVSVEWPHSAAPPSGWLKEDGSEQLIASYTALYNLYTANGTSFPYGANTNGAGAAGSTHFRMRNHKGRVSVGLDSAQAVFDALGETGGAVTHTLTAAEMPVHSHGMDGAGSHGHTSATGSAGDHTHVASSGDAGTHNHVASTDVTGSHGHTATSNDHDVNHFHSADTGFSGGHEHTYISRGGAVPQGTGNNVAANWSFSTYNTAGGGGHSHAFNTGYMASNNVHGHTIAVATSGAHNHTVTIDTNGLHSHPVTVNNNGSHVHTISTDGNHTHNIQNTGSGGPHNNLQPYIVTYFIIKT